MIPKIFHFIWISDNLDVDNEVPEYITANVNTFFNLNTKYDIRIWTNRYIKKLIDEQDDILKNFIYSLDSLVQRTDVLRMLILNKFGGIYCDSDMICVNNFDDLLKNNFVGQEESEHLSYRVENNSVSTFPFNISNAVIGAEKDADFTKKYLELVTVEENKVRTSLGPKLVDKAIYFSKDRKKINLLPPEYFYSCAYFRDMRTLKITSKTKVIHIYYRSK